MAAKLGGRAIYRWALALITLVVLCVASPPALAGRLPADAPQVDAKAVKIGALPRGYRTFDGGWLKLAYPPALEHWVEPLVAEAETFKQRAVQRFGRPVLSQVKVRLATTPKQMKKLAPKGAPYPSYAAGVAYSGLDLILLTRESVTANANHDLKEVFRHELAHVALHDAVGGQRVPLWFNEGLAVMLSGENAFARMRTLWTATVTSNLIDLKEIERRFPEDSNVAVPLAYAQSADIMRYLTRRQEASRFELLIKRLRRGQQFDFALADSYGMDTLSLQEAWQTNVEERYSLWPVLFSGGALGALGFALVVLAWRRKRRKQAITLKRWGQEEALADLRVALRRQKTEDLPWFSAARLRLLGGRTRPPVKKTDQVKHGGGWHTLH